jgi:hypothetical protein
MRAMRSSVVLALVGAVGAVGCATDPAEPPDSPTGPQPLDVVWSESIHAGDLIVMVPGTGSYNYLAQPIEALPPANPLVVDVTKVAPVAGDSVVFEQAIGAAQRAGFTDADLEAGAVTFGIWGAGFTKLTSFVYLSYEGIHLPVTILGGENTCATGSIFADLLNYNTTDALTDANDLYAKIQTYLAANPSSTGAPRNVVIASHSWGGALSEYLGFHLADVEAAHGALADTGGVASMPFTIADGVPAFILSYSLAGPGIRPLNGGYLYEVDRPDDPVHAMDPSGDGDGHMYTILYGDQFVGSYGVTTMELSCAGVPGECPVPPPPPAGP